MALLPWALRRQLLYLAGAGIFLVVLVGIPVFFSFYRAPSCDDGNQNQGEEGIDCGGPCVLLCKAVVVSPIVHWQRPFEVSDGVWSVVAYVENSNVNSTALHASYRFKLYDENNLLVSERVGETRIPPRSNIAIFESGIETGTRRPARAIFEFLEPLSWARTEESDPQVPVVDQVFAGGVSPRLSANLLNPELSPVENVEVVAVLFDSVGNAFAASRTEVERVGPHEKVPLVFTWPRAFRDEPARLEFLTRVLR